MKVTKKVLEHIEDDVQLQIDNFFEKLTIYFNREARLLKEEHLRAVCVDNPHVPADAIQDVYRQVIKESLSKENINYYTGKWGVALGLP